MNTHFDLTDTEFEMAFQTCSLDPGLFSHEAHLRLAWIHIKKYGLEQAIENILLQLLQFVDHVGARDKFNKTVTVAAIRAVNHFISKSKSSNFQDFIQEYPRLKFNFKELLSFHYGHDIFKSERAKREYIQPDLLPF